MQTIGLHVEGDCLYTALLTKERKGVRIAHFQIFPSSDVKQIYTLPKLKKKGAILATGLPCQHVVTRTLSFRLKSKATLLSALPFQIENSVPFPPDETLAYSLLHKKRGEEMPLTLFATKRSSLESHLEEWQRHKIDPDAVSCMPNALHRFANHAFPSIPSLFLFYQGEAQCTWLILQENRIIFSQSLVSIPKNRLDQELSRIKQFAQTKVPDFLSLPFVLCGPKADVDLFTHHFGTPIPTSDLSLFAAPIGFALDALLQDKRSVEWRQQTAPTHKTKKRFKRHLSNYLLVSLFFATLFGSLHTLHLKKKKSTLENKLSVILERPVNLEEGLTTLEEASNTSNTTASLIPGIPLVSDVLQWIGTHPLLKQKGLNITRVHYQLERFPKLGEKKEPYLASVEMEITTSSPTLARDFHNALLKGDSLVDAKKEITWKTSHNAYYTKFYTKKIR